MNRDAFKAIAEDIIRQSNNELRQETRERIISAMERAYLQGWDAGSARGVREFSDWDKAGQ